MLDRYQRLVSAYSDDWSRAARRAAMTDLHIPASRRAARRRSSVATSTTRSTTGCCASGSSSSAARSTTRSPTGSARSCCCSRPRTPSATSTSTSTRPAARSTAGMAIYDTMQFVDNDVATVAMGLAASMGQFLLCAGAHGQALRPAARADHDAPALRRHRRHRVRHRDPGRADALHQADVRS